MIAPTERNLAFAKQAASTAAFRILFGFLAFGIVDFVDTLARIAVTPLLKIQEELPIDPFSIDRPLRIAFIAVAAVSALLKLGLLVWMLRRRLSPAQPMALWVAIGAIGLGCRIGAMAASGAFVSSLTRTSSAYVIAEWSMAMTLASAASLVFETLVLGGAFVASAMAMVNDRVPAEKPPTYRHAPSD